MLELSEQLARDRVGLVRLVERSERPGALQTELGLDEPVASGGDERPGFVEQVERLACVSALELDVGEDVMGTRRVLLVLGRPYDGNRLPGELRCHGRVCSSNMKPRLRPERLRQQNRISQRFGGAAEIAE